MKNSEPLVLDVEDYRGKRVVFTEKKRKQKLSKHPHLIDAKFIGFLERAIVDPDQVWQDLDDPKRKRCYYYKYSAYRYVKAVVWIADDPCLVVTAYDLDYIKELNYPKLKRLL
ncbi:MAG: hypothetical protein A2383_01455 [Candidatus Pacebacteria bacterium RIFOXYB1_FULL_39_46]|nr:MAG: hypothetical protein A2383_01455 [Candidatus Pacebacteria bacterium RIFOXYB1_FULL_39_46]OGJ39057.1 MAG: hypothetical protein A2182_01875 [Candidatus Pacebacteria bacterium RIFOXYA1_FULL_38_18]OGJ40028.1 MAG: hypothetical protein A2582_01400 [Candidatus Pacebacteria bacterium RIFOXYD1_FULL_39_27]OGJ40710.1 MAG: hypothetical protein A2411_00295 [Candidatus Pacebacteria bacterium RIFOXYC1_FULL_39_21]